MQCFKNIIPHESFETKDSSRDEIKQCNKLYKCKWVKLTLKETWLNIVKK